MFILGLTGGIGSGKSTVAGILQSIGAAVIDADAISRRTTQAGGAAIDAIRDAFGADVLTAENALDRDAMRQMISQAPDVKIRLEAIIHPLVGAEIDDQIHLATSQQRRLLVLDIPLLAEGGSRWRKRVHHVWVVDCLPQTQIQRVVDRSNWSPQQVQSMLSLQASRPQRLACADTVVYNDGISLPDLRGLVQRMAEPLL
jgi:dephospho-CoA kinase